jgi:thiol-disulfide isomerase/thioredoxin
VRARVAILLLPLAGFLPPAAVPAERGDDEVRAAITRGHELLERRLTAEAVRAFREADKLAGGSSVAALVGLAQAHLQLGAEGTAEKHARRALAAAGDNVFLQVAAHNVLGIALLAGAGGDADQLAKAEAAFRAALAGAGDTSPVLKLNLAEALMRQGEDAEAAALLEAYLATEPSGPEAARARSLLDDPRRARENVVPAFEMVTLDGRRLTPADFAGRAVLLDFWGTWCAPCRQATPALGRLAKRLEGEPFELVAVSNDAEREVLEKYVAEHAMDWTQVWDRDGSVARDAFLVRSYPTYVVLDHEGRVIYRVSGWGESIRRALERRVHSAVRDARKAAPGEGDDGGG